MRRQRVIFLTGSLRVGGTERNVVHLATGLDRTRFDVEVWSDYEGEPLQLQLRRSGVRCRSLKGAPSLGRPLHVRLLRHNLPYQRRLLSLLREERRSVIHAFGFPMAYYAVLLGRLAGCRRIIFSVQDWDVWKRSGIFSALDRICSRLAWCVVADGRGACQFAAWRQGMAPERMLTIYDGVDPDELRPGLDAAAVRKELGLSPDRPTVGMVARLDIVKKGQDVFIAAIPRIVRANADAQFVIVGDGPDRARVESLVATLPGACRPVLAGGREDLANVLNALDVLVIPSRWESVPKVLLEGMWMERPIVATRVGDIPEVFDETCGVLVERDDPGALAQAVSGLLADPARACRLGCAARRRIIERRLTLDDTIRRYEDLYTSWAR